MKQARVHTISGEEQHRYTTQLDSFLEVLVTGLTSTHERVSGLKQFGEQHRWNWNRAPLQQKTYQALAKLVQKVRENYQWFQWRTNSVDPQENRGYFNKIEISAESGLPWLFQIMELHRVQRDAPQLLEQLPLYPQAAAALQELILTDHTPLPEVKAAAEKNHRQALQRNYVEQLQQFPLLGWDSSGFSLEPQAAKVIALGVEDLWSISLIRYSPGSGLFHAYVIDTWQDLVEPQITEVPGTEPGLVSAGLVSADLQKTLKFHEDNAAWYILKTIDQKFNSLHPVHVSRAVIGPFENKYLTEKGKTLPITSEMIRQDSTAGLLRFNRQYAYAPNNLVVDDIPRQIIHQENWNDEIIVCPGAYSSLVSQSVLGTDVRIFKA